MHPHSLAFQQKQRSFLTFGFGAGSSGGASRRESHVNVNVTPTSQHDATSDTPEIRKYKKRFNSEILCAALWGVNLLIGTENGLMLLDRSGQGKVNKSRTHHCNLVLMNFLYRFINLFPAEDSSKWKFLKVKIFSWQFPARRIAFASTIYRGWSQKFSELMDYRMWVLQRFCAKIQIN